MNDVLDLWCSEEETDKHVELRMCLATRLPLPVTVQRCHVDCHAPCQLTEWSAWTLCNQPCSGARSRIRQLIGRHIFILSIFLYFNRLYIMYFRNIYKPIIRPIKKIMRDCLIMSLSHL